MKPSFNKKNVIGSNGDPGNNAMWMDFARCNDVPQPGDGVMKRILDQNYEFQVGVFFKQPLRVGRN